MKKRSILAFLVCGLVATSLAGCGGGGSSYKSDSTANYAMAEEAAEYDYSDDIYDSYEEAKVEEESANGAEESEPVNAKESNRKIIKTVNINAETEEFDKFVSTIQAKVDALGGYLESTDISGRSINSSTDYLRNASITARVPSDKLDDFVTHVTDNSNITNKSESAEDVTLSYADTKAHVSSLRTEQDRLNELIKEANDIDTLIILEQRLTEVRYEIESYESRLRTIDNKVDYSTVYMNVSEVRKYTPVVTEKQSFGERVATGFMESLIDVGEGIVNFVAELIIASPYLIVILIMFAIFGLIIFIVVKIILKIVKTIDAKTQAANKKNIAKAPKKAVNAPANNAAPVNNTAPVNNDTTNK